MSHMTRVVAIYIYKAKSFTLDINATQNKAKRTIVFLFWERRNVELFHWGLFRRSRRLQHGPAQVHPCWSQWKGTVQAWGPAKDQYLRPQWPYSQNCAETGEQQTEATTTTELRTPTRSVFGSCCCGFFHVSFACMHEDVR